MEVRLRKDRGLNVTRCAIVCGIMAICVSRLHKGSSQPFISSRSHDDYATAIAENTV